MAIMQGGNSGTTSQHSTGAYQHVQAGISSVSVPTAQSTTIAPNQGKNSAGGPHHQHHPTSVSL